MSGNSSTCLAESLPERRVKVLLAASECVPFVKTGGLADVLGALPQQLAQLGADVRVVLPRYKQLPFEYASRLKHECDFYIQLGWRRQYCGVESLQKDGVTYYFIDNEYYFARDYIYGGFTDDEAERFAFFDKAILEMLPRLGFFPNALHLNDWQCGMVAALYKLQYANRPDYRGIRTVFTVHNLRYQGIFKWDFVSELLGLPAECFTADKLEFCGCANYLKAGLIYADMLTTVSPTYAKEIQTPAYGEGMDGVLRARSASLFGIMNGIDLAMYDPAADPLLPARFSKSDLSGKALCKAKLRAELGLNAEADAPVVGMVSRLTGQKGLDLVECVINDIMRTSVQLAVLGTGEARYEQLFAWAAWRYPGRIAARMEYSERLAHMIYGGADMFLMPSLFEPCGLAQLIAMRYGTLPIVRETGGLKDSVQPYNKFADRGVGFSFANYNAHEMLYTLERADELYHSQPEAFTRMQRRAMEKQLSWEDSAHRYLALYASV